MGLPTSFWDDPEPVQGPTRFFDALACIEGCQHSDSDWGGKIPIILAKTAQGRVFIHSLGACKIDLPTSILNTSIDAEMLDGAITFYGKTRIIDVLMPTEREIDAGSLIDTYQKRRALIYFKRVGAALGEPFSDVECDP